MGRGIKFENVSIPVFILVACLNSQDLTEYCSTGRMPCHHLIANWLIHNSYASFLSRSVTTDPQIQLKSLQCTCDPDLTPYQSSKKGIAFRASPVKEGKIKWKPGLCTLSLKAIEF